jgi:hypothetical protein
MKSFKHPAPTQREIIRLLEESPLPWTTGMLRDWFGTRHGSPFDLLVQGGRIRKISDGFYTALTNECPRHKVIVTDKMLERYGFNL